ncbi:osteopetrosis-associated transmembrane protein 1-like isoform X2 [Mercenaria mercenaria]|uniref:osteopetrosis-associated transmembrane protein 1-like isoform X2 n=1 Tax=Mercenaria mercenaria TaxID=6596 RepID=UPI00234F9B67|nr:osteopetrosis-associated transmembrane protein 1-like isoform X2 [Mercenaria mercenaria]
MCNTNKVVLLVFCVYAVASSGITDELAFTYLRWKLNLNQERLSEIASGQNIGATRSNTSNIRPDCKAFIQEFGLRSSRFIKCSVDNARPFRFCEGCVVHYRRSKTVYNDIVENDETLDNCRKELLNSDRVQVITSVQRDIDKIWENADCKECFSSISEDTNGTVHYTLTKRTVQFLTVYRNFTHCIPSNMNYTRLTWGEQLKCTNVHKEYTAVLTIAVGLLLLPPVFYVALAVYGTKRTRNLIKQKRLAIFQHTSTYGTLDSPPLPSEHRLVDSESHDSANQTAASIESLGSEDKNSTKNGTLNNRTTYTFA